MAYACQWWGHIIFAWPRYLDLRSDSRSIHNSRIKGTGDLANSIAHQYTISGIGVTPLPHAREPRGRIAVIDLSGLTKPQLERLGCTCSYAGTVSSSADSFPWL